MWLWMETELFKTVGQSMSVETFKEARSLVGNVCALRMSGCTLSVFDWQATTRPERENILPHTVGSSHA